MAEHDDTIARNIVRLRADQRLTLGELARRAAVSKQTLSVIERGLANPTVGTLGAIADALGTTLQNLVVETGSPVVVRHATDAVWAEAAGGSARLLDQLYGSGYVRNSIVRLVATAPRPSAVLYRGSLHHVYVIEGEVQVGPIGHPVALVDGDFGRFPADAPHVLLATSSTATVHLVTTFPQLEQLPAVPSE